MCLCCKMHLAIGQVFGCFSFNGKSKFLAFQTSSTATYNITRKCSCLISVQVIKIEKSSICSLKAKIPFFNSPMGYLSKYGSTTVTLRVYVANLNASPSTVSDRFERKWKKAQKRIVFQGWHPLLFGYICYVLSGKLRKITLA